MVNIYINHLHCMYTLHMKCFHYDECTVWKNEKFTLTEIFFRQINYLVILLVKSLFSRNFCQKSVRVNFRSFLSVERLVF